MFEEDREHRTANRRGRRYKQRKKISVNTIVLCVAIVVFIISASQLLRILKEYRVGEEEYGELQSLIIEAEEVESTEEFAEEGPRFAVDFAKLLEINPDTVAWIRFDNPDIISYPVVASKDNMDYLYTTFEGKHNSAGTLFVDYRNTGDFTEENTVIHGHNMKNGSMFGRLRKYRSQEFCQENPYFYIYLPDGTEMEYEVFAVCVVDDTSQTYDSNYGSEAEYQEYLDYVYNNALYDTNVEVVAADQIVTLSTCTSVTDHERLVVHGMKIGERGSGE